MRARSAWLRERYGHADMGVYADGAGRWPAVATGDALELVQADLLA